MNRVLQSPGLPRLIGLIGLVGLVGLIGLAPAFAQAPRTMRLDFYHTGTATTEVFSLDRLVIEPTPWPGNPQKPIDDTNFGKYLF
jgi:Peptidase M64 N-terminus